MRWTGAAKRGARRGAFPWSRSLRRRALAPQAPARRRWPSRRRRMRSSGRRRRSSRHRRPAAHDRRERRQERRQRRPCGFRGRAHPRECVPRPQGFVSHSARCLAARWRAWLTDGSLAEAARQSRLSGEVARVLLSEAAAAEAARGVARFCERLASCEVPADLARNLEEFCTCIGAREYAAANRAYLEIVMGSRKWQTDVPYLVEGNRNGPSVVQSVAERLNKGMSHPLDAAGIRDYTVLLRRLLSVAQTVHPNADPSKNCG
mmetsp:Transcript_38907/g.108135  ORF Transcript_38907/g.108135 Transcript_38907/m.108135 type:complete len:262 (-) Transcript_38907:36-821(-)